MTPSRWTRRIALRTLLIIGLALGMIALASHLVFNYIGVLWFFAIVGITCIILTICIGLAFMLLFDDKQNENKLDDFNSGRRP